MRSGITFPGGARFAFTILDDTDDSTLENVRPVYECLEANGLRTTKTAWPFESPGGSEIYFAADTLERAEYRDFVKELVAKGFELASHGASMESSERATTLRSIEAYRADFGACPRLHANHGQNRENLYWGAARFQTPGLRTLAGLAATEYTYDGHVPASPFYWGDVAAEHFDYVRNFTFRELNMLRANPEMPYRLDSTPGVRAWFSTTDAPNADVFAQRITPASLDRLEAEGGVCIVSTHLGKGFSEDGRLRPDIQAIFENIGRRKGYFAPVSKILDHLAGDSGPRRLGTLGLARLEARYFADKIADRLFA